jgi:hypothetical protein
MRGVRYRKNALSIVRMIATFGCHTNQRTIEQVRTNRNDAKRVLKTLSKTLILCSSRSFAYVGSIRSRCLLRASSPGHVDASEVSRQVEFVVKE